MVYSSVGNYLIFFRFAYKVRVCRPVLSVVEIGRASG